ncbi:MAG: MBOAT family protein [Lachnospiraceae bacterium]|nr:MBOAT family protein [Lachnospiraceae bacterium]
MLFSSLEFIFRFLPVFLLVYYLVPRTWKNAVLLLGSIVFYAFGEPKYVILIAASVVVNYLLAVFMSGQKGKLARRLVFIVDIIFNVGILIVFKYLGFIVGNINRIPGTSLSVPEIALPLGISFYTFQILSYEADVYKKRIPYDRSLIDLGAYILMFPQLIAGPIVNYREVALDMKSRVLKITDIEEGLRPFITGLSMKVLLANNLGTVWDNVGTAGYENISTIFAWIGAAAYTLQIYFDFAGYSLMAIGLGRMLGFTLPENFDHPYMAVSVRDFWNRWHITLTRWFREYIYIPLGGNRKGRLRTYVNLLVVWFITGLWHGAEWSFILWGLYYFCFVVLERLVLGKVLDKLPGFVGRIYTLVVVMVGWVLFATESVENTLVYITRMFGAHGGSDYMDHIASVAALLVCGAIFATPVFDRFMKRFGRSWIGTVVLFLLFWASVIALVDTVYNPFLYFRF